MSTDHILYREKGTLTWKAGFICDRYGDMIRIGSYRQAPEYCSVWYAKGDIEMKVHP